MRYLIPCLTCLIILVSCGKNKEPQAEEIYRPVRYATVIKASGNDNYTFSGTAQSADETNLSFKVAGTIRTVEVKLGDRVRKGQIIATLDPADYNIQYEQTMAQEKGAEANMISAKTQIKSAETNLIATRSTFRRVESLYENNSVPLSEYEQAKAAYEAAQSQFEAAKAQHNASETQVTASSKQMQSAKNKVDYTRLSAPFDGVITQINIEANELVGSGNPIAIISSEIDPEVNLGVPEIFINKISKGQKVNIGFSVIPGKKFEGIVEEVAFAAGSSPTYPVIVRIVNPGSDIRPGMAANVNFNFNKGASALIEQIIAPVKAVGQDADGNFVFVLTKSSDNVYAVEKRKVEIGRLVALGFEIKKGLKEGELVATAGLKSLLEGMKVKLLEQ